MPETALTQTERLLQLIPLAGREGGVPYDELAGTLGIDRRQLERDLETLTARDFYLPGGAVNDLQVTLDDERVRVWTTGPLRRPTRLTPGEAAALDLGLRMAAVEPSHPARELLDRVARTEPDHVPRHIAADGDPDAADRLRALLIDAARRRRRVTVRYLKPDADAAETRDVEPYVVAHGEGRWYVVGRDPAPDEVRVFRIDRILEATATDATFDPPPDFDPSDWVRGGRVYRADEELEVTVRYSPRVAPWLRERGEGEAQDDGSVLVRHRVSDPGWVVRHVLRYGAEAEVVGPEEARGWVREAVESLRRAAMADCDVAV